MVTDTIRETAPSASDAPLPEPGASFASSAARLQSGTVVALSLYLLTATLLVVRLGDQPPFPFNWEDYTAQHVFALRQGPEQSALRILGLSDGLMTDSGQNPLVGLPVALGFAVGGIGLVPMRLPVALLAAAAVPLLWIVGRRLVPSGVALLAALLLALSPVFLLYGRTATIVGVSLVPELLTVLALLHVLAGRPDGAGWRWLGGLQLALIAGEYAYAPVRLLWPLALALLAGGALLRPARRRWLLGALALSAIVLPLALVAIDRATGQGSDPQSVVAGYFRARGEQIVALRDAPDDYGYYLRPTPEEEISGGVHGDAVDLARRLVGQNIGDLLRLVVDRDTLPTLTDHWNARGRLWPALFAPLLVLGLLATLRRAVVGRDADAVALLLLAGGLTLPLLLTSRVHIGRLLPSLPFLLLLVAIGTTATGRWIGAWLAVARRSRRISLERWATAGVAGLVVAVALLSAWAEFRVAIPPTREVSTVAALRELTGQAARRGEVALIDDPALGADVERLHAADYRLQLDSLYRFVDLDRPDPTKNESDDRPALLFGDVLGRLDDGSLPDPCRPLYVVVPEVEDAFRKVATGAAARAGCGGPLRNHLLPP